jgi:preprotein translocase subunit YajC
MTLRAAFLATAFLATAAAAPVLAQETAPAAPAAAPAKANVTAGASVLDAKGGAVGTVESVAGDQAVVNTGVVKASLPVSAFAQSDKGLLISMTKVELENAAKGAAAGQADQLVAALTPGTAITDQSGGAIGKVDSVEGEFVVVATPNTKVKLPRSAFAKGPNGPIIGMTLAQLEAAAKGSGG